MLYLFGNILTVERGLGLECSKCGDFIAATSSYQFSACRIDR
jgi:hypothetical protein